MEINSHPFDRSGSKNVLFHQALRSWRTEYQIKWVGFTVLKHVKKYLGIPVATTYFFGVSGYPSQCFNSEVIFR